jgi:SAM-dependent methyltransferase
MTRPPRKHTEVLREQLDFAGKRAIDVGCGDGALVRAMTRFGARTTGVEVTEVQLARARAAEPAGDEDYVFASGHSLPFAEASLDIVVYFNSLHHLPAVAMAPALAEAARVLVPGGVLYVAEPLAEGPHFEVVRPIDDETVVRTLAYREVQWAAKGPAFTAEAEIFYDTTRGFADFDAFREVMEAIDPSRQAIFERELAALKRNFETLAERDGDTHVFRQPMRVNLLRRSAE